MLYLLDTADTKAIARLHNYMPLAGVTTNPSIIAKAKSEFLPLLKEIRSIIGDNAALHAQVLGQTAEEMSAEADYYAEKISGDFYVKIPVTPEGLRAMQMLKPRGFKITATAIFTAQQALLASRAGADFVAPYVNRIDNSGGNGVETVAEIVQLFQNFALPTKVLGASFKNTRQVAELALTGCDAATMPPEIMEGLLHHPLTDSSVQQFESDWLSVYNKLSVINV